MAGEIIIPDKTTLTNYPERAARNHESSYGTFFRVTTFGFSVS
ncbi:hypothetical protein SDC9_18150 [bioreactor metagenome]|uniref:Uncharacterized protein n=1 Tax=bioreactor metagenome TaxID=1076179 RepID=A0A644U0Z7_9ZZZZ